MIICAFSPHVYLYKTVVGSSQRTDGHKSTSLKYARLSVDEDLPLLSICPQIFNRHRPRRLSSREKVNLVLKYALRHLLPILLLLLLLLSLFFCFVLFCFVCLFVCFYYGCCFYYG